MAITVLLAGDFQQMISWIIGKEPSNSRIMYSMYLIPLAVDQCGRRFERLRTGPDRAGPLNYLSIGNICHLRIRPRPNDFTSSPPRQEEFHGGRHWGPGSTTRSSDNGDLDIQILFSKVVVVVVNWRGKDY